MKDNQQLIHFLEYLQHKSGKPYPNGFLEDLAKVEFNLPTGYQQMNFHPIGINNKKTMQFSNPLANENWKELVVISPFVDNVTIRNLNKLTANKIRLLSRKEELDNIELDLIIAGARKCTDACLGISASFPFIDPANQRLRKSNYKSNLRTGLISNTSGITIGLQLCNVSVAISGSCRHQLRHSWGSHSCSWGSTLG